MTSRHSINESYMPVRGKMGSMHAHAQVAVYTDRDTILAPHSQVNSSSVTVQSVH